ncbi:hypothetical protein QE152_g38723 [Popillia japonica]|uniref:Uncharacterized protein n=1 Tax=Popillia japonica TaxID=7064 RepID=A0AAW1HVL2_POPJA
MPTMILDEDSGDEQDLGIHNLPASQLLAEAEVFNAEKIDNEEEWDDSDELPLSHHVKSKSKKIIKKSYQWDNTQHGRNLILTHNISILRGYLLLPLLMTIHHHCILQSEIGKLT